MTVSVKSRLRERMREHDGANVPVLKMTVPLREKAGVLMSVMFYVFFVFLSGKWSVHISHHRASKK